MGASKKRGSSMRICVVSGVGEHFKGRHILDALQRLGHEVAVLDDWNYGFSTYRRWSDAIRYVAPRVPIADRLLRQRVARQFLEIVRASRPDLVLVTRGDRLGAEALAECRRAGRPRLVLWASDSVFHVPAMFAALPTYDDVFVKDTYLVEELRKLGFPNVRYLGQCCSQSLHRPLELSADDRREFGGGVAVVGRMYPERIALLEAVRSLPLRIWLDLPGIRLPRGSPLLPFVTNRRVTGLEQTKVFSASDLVLNHHHPQDIFGINLRTFEAAGAGACQLVDSKRDLGLFFEAEREVVVYRSPAELIERARWLLDHPAERAEIGRRAAQRAHRDHTYDCRMAELLDMVGAPP